MNLSAKAPLAAIALLLCAGCACVPAGQKIVHKASPVNLAGFPAAYKEGYGDACSGAKDTKRYKTDQQYKQGWQDGGFTCKKTTAFNPKPRTAWAGTE